MTTQEWLTAFLQRHGAVAGTVHVQRGDDLYLEAAHNIPPPVLAAVEHVPRGKGMAGLAQVRREPVQTCNLQTDDSGAVRPGARAVDAKAGVALPVFGPDGSVRAVVGLAWMHEGAVSPELESDLMTEASSLP